MTTLPAPNAPALSAMEFWSQRVRRIGGLIQLAFAAFWLIRGGLAIPSTGGLLVAAACSCIAIAAAIYGIRVTAGGPARQTSPEARRIERAVNLATVVQLAASFLAPAVVLAAGRPSWVLPSIAITIGPLLLWLDHRVGIPRYRIAGVVLIVMPVVLVVTLSGVALSATTGIASGVILLGTAIAGFHDLAGSKRPRGVDALPDPHPAVPGVAAAPPIPGGFAPFTNPATGEWVQFTDTAETTGGEFVRFLWSMRPGGTIPEHLHPEQEERFTITGGEGTFTIDGRSRTFTAGHTLVVPVGVAHSVVNRGSVPLTGEVRLAPALSTKEMHEAFAGLAAEGKVGPGGAPRNPLRLGATVWHFRHENRVTAPPIWFQNVLLPPLWLLAKAVRVHPYLTRWDSRVRPAPSGQPLLDHRPPRAGGGDPRPPERGPVGVGPVRD